MTDPIHLVAKTGEGVLLIETDKHGTGGVFLYHHENDGSVWDTWHRTVDEAKEQAIFQFGLAGEFWLQIPPGVSDPISFARGALTTKI
jgi:hypothetical protein